MKSLINSNSGDPSVRSESSTFLSSELQRKINNMFFGCQTIFIRPRWDHYIALSVSPSLRQSLALLNFAQIVGIFQSLLMDLFKVCSYMEFVKVVYYNTLGPLSK